MQPDGSPNDDPLLPFSLPETCLRENPCPCSSSRGSPVPRGLFLRASGPEKCPNAGEIWTLASHSRLPVTPPRIFPGPPPPQNPAAEIPQPGVPNQTRPPPKPVADQPAAWLQAPRDLSQAAAAGLKKKGGPLRKTQGSNSWCSNGIPSISAWLNSRSWGPGPPPHRRPRPTSPVRKSPAPNPPPGMNGTRAVPVRRRTGRRAPPSRRAGRRLGGCCRRHTGVSTPQRESAGPGQPFAFHSVVVCGATDSVDDRPLPQIDR